jgi:hypothetical protein
MNEFHYSIRWAWKGRSETPASIAEKYRRTLNELSHSNPAFHDWGVGVTRKEGRLARLEVISDMESVVRANVKRDDWKKPDPDSGYGMFATSDVFASENFVPHDLSLRFKVGSKWGNDIGFQVGGLMVPSDLRVATFSLFKSVLSILTSIWSPEWADAYIFKVGYQEPGVVAGIPVFPYSRFHIPWITYLSTPLAEGVTPPPGIQSEQTSDGGLLMVATQDQLDPANPEHMRLAKALADLMIAATGEMG